MWLKLPPPTPCSCYVTSPDGSRRAFDHWLWKGWGRGDNSISVVFCWWTTVGIFVLASDATKQYSRLKVSTPNRGTDFTALCQLSMWAGIAVGTGSREGVRPKCDCPTPFPWCYWRVVWWLVGSCVSSVPQILIRIQFCLLGLPKILFSNFLTCASRTQSSLLRFLMGVSFSHSFRYQNMLTKSLVGT